MSRLGSVLSSLAQHSLCLGTRIGGRKTGLGLSHGRTLSLTPRRWKTSKKPADEDEGNSQPIKFSTSKASHRTWNVNQSLGSNYERPLWKVIPISVLGVALVLWCVLRGETDIDKKLEKSLYEHLPGLLSEEEDEEPVQGKSS